MSVMLSQTFSGGNYVSASACSSPSHVPHHADHLYLPEILIYVSVDKIHSGRFAPNYPQNINPQTAGCSLSFAQRPAAGREKKTTTGFTVSKREQNQYLVMTDQAIVSSLLSFFN